MKAQIYSPSPVLSQYIDSYMLVDINWKDTSILSSIWRLIPYGKSSMLLLYGDPHEYNLEGPEHIMQKTRQAFMVGQLTKPIWIKFTGHTRLIKIQFKSNGTRQLLPLDMEEFKNIPSLDLEAIWGYSVHMLIEQLHCSNCDEERIQRLNEFLEARLLRKNDSIDYVDYTLNVLHTNQGNIPIKGLEEKLGISTRHLERLFRSKVGLTPKELSKIIRLNAAFSHLEANPNHSIGSLAFEAGYYDQAHFSRDFQGITGARPSKLFSEKSNELFVTHGKCFINIKPPFI